MQNKNPCTQAYSTPHKNTPAGDINKNINNRAQENRGDYDEKCHDHKDK
jgi:hypothetical protein